MSLVVEVKVVPGSKTQAFSIDAQGLVKCALKSQPEKGKANEELIKLLSKKLGVPQQSITIISGYSGRKKRIKIADDTITLQKFCLLCGICS